MQTNSACNQRSCPVSDSTGLWPGWRICLYMLCGRGKYALCVCYLKFLVEIDQDQGDELVKKEICGNRETREMYSVQPAPFAASPSCGLIGARCDTATCMPLMGKSHARPLILSAQMSLGCVFAPAIFDLIAPAYSATHLVCSNSDI